MKKFLAIVLALCTLSAAAIGFAACGDDDETNSASSSTSSTTSSESSSSSSSSSTDSTSSSSSNNNDPTEEDPTETVTTVTEEEWAAAFSYEKFLNCTVKYEYTYSSGSSGTVYAHYDLAVENGVTTGGVYIEELNTETQLAEPYAYRNKTAEYNAYARVNNNVWSCNSVDLEPNDKFTGDNINIFVIESYISTYFVYSDYTYDSESDMYICTKELDGYTDTLKIQFSGGKLVYVSVEEVEGTSTYLNEYTLSDYSTTTVTIPTEVMTAIETAVEAEKAEQSQNTVTEEQWTAAFSYGAFLNCTLKYEYGGKILNVYYDLSVENGITVGEAYLESGDSATENMQPYSYYIKTADYAAEATYSGETWSCNSGNVDTNPSADYEENINAIAMEEVQALFFVYSDYTYDSESDVYICFKEVDEYSYELRVQFDAEGNIIYVYIFMEEEGDLTSRSLSEYTFSDYGTTTVTAPDGVMEKIETAVEEAKETEEV